MIDPSSLRAVTLDLDDTLWPVGPTLVAAERVLADWLRAHAPRTAAAYDAAARAELRRTLLAEHPAQAHDMSFLRRESLRRALAASGEDPSLAVPAFDVFLAARQAVVPFDDVVPVLERWSARFRIVAVTNGNADVARTPLGRFFHGSVAAHEIGVAKPDARMFAEACRLAGAAPSQVLHVGDDPELDVAAARRAGLHAAWVRRPEIPHRLPADHFGPDALPPFETLHALDVALRGHD